MKKVLITISGQNAENMTVLVQSMKDTVPKTESGSVSSAAGGAKVARLTKPAKVPTWTKDLSLETYIKQIETWNEVNEDVPTNTKYQDFVESLKTNKDITGLP